MPSEGGRLGEDEPDSIVSQPVHPWLASTSTTSSPPQQFTSSSSQLKGLASASSGYANFGDIGNFVSAYAVNKGSNSLANGSSSSNSTPNKDSEQQSTPDFYANLNTDTAALIW